DAWIICLLAFKGRRRPLLQPGRYTELFFLDEATALAAGHRPCGECRHADLRRFGAAWRGGGSSGFTLARDIDAVLRHERVQPADRRPTLGAEAGRPAAGEIPADGLMFGVPGRDEAYLASGGRLLRWTPAGYVLSLPFPEPTGLVLLTPPSTAAAIANGYRPQMHPSALR
ncbi:MAG: hypothetical protein KIT16_10590, partial [Rhodospirillaceae bacterium]|nr:hypothetical protein [Rhodospirillaceae bacterium]